MGAATSGSLKILHDQQQSQIVSANPLQNGPNKVRDVVEPTSPQSTSEPLNHGHSQKDLPRQTFLGHSISLTGQPSLQLL